MIANEYFLILALIMFFCGIIGVIFRRNLLTVLMAIQLMFNSAVLAFVTATNLTKNTNGSLMVILVITIGLCQTGIGVTMIIEFFKKHKTVNTDLLRILRG